MKPPMHDQVQLMTPALDVNGKPVKDGRGFPKMESIDVMARVKKETTVVIDAEGQERNSNYTVLFPKSVNPSLGDQVHIIDETITVPIIKATPRRSYSGKNIYYWMTNCGE